MTGGLVIINYVLIFSGLCGLKIKKSALVRAGPREDKISSAVKSALVCAGLRAKITLRGGLRGLRSLREVGG